VASIHIDATRNNRLGKILTDFVLGDERQSLDVVGGPDSVDVHSGLIVFSAVEGNIFVSIPDGADQAFFAQSPLKPGWETGADVNIDD